MRQPKTKDDATGRLHAAVGLAGGGRSLPARAASPGKRGPIALLFS